MAANTDPASTPILRKGLIGEEQGYGIAVATETRRSDEACPADPRRRDANARLDGNKRRQRDAERRADDETKDNARDNSDGVG